MQHFAWTTLFSRFAPGLLKGTGAALLAGVLSQCTATPPKGDLVVSVKDQKLGVYAKDGRLAKKYVISTSKFGLGDRTGSNCTPLGQHEIVAKIGHGLPAGAVLKSRHWNGEVLKPNAPGRDPIVSRILWLKGMEKTNRNAFNRFIYIHGTPEEKNLGRPASFGCVRMGMKDVVDLFNNVDVGVKVTITTDHLPRGAVEKHAEPADVDGSPALAAPVDGQPLQIAKVTASDAEKKRAAENEAKTKTLKDKPVTEKDKPEQASITIPVRKSSDGTPSSKAVAGKSSSPKSKGKSKA